MSHQNESSKTWSIRSFLCSDIRMNSLLKTLAFENHSLTTSGDICIINQWKIFDTMKFFVIDFTQIIWFLLHFQVFSLLSRIPTVKLKIPWKAFLKSESRTSLPWKNCEKSQKCRSSKFLIRPGNQWNSN